MKKQLPTDIAGARQFVLDLEKKCKVADYAYKVSTEDASDLLEIIKTFGEKISDKEKMDYRNPPPAYLAKNIFIGVIDRETARMVSKFLSQNPKLDYALENDLRAGLMRMAGH